ncbi:hypothetical protein NIES4103_28850 [Nostoc sp. NIES-4103]|nr:hypothetical protein NIES4103_28850 [Nostoc sp. NIES-4103]
MLKTFAQPLRLGLVTSTCLGLLLFLTSSTIAGFVPTNRKPASDYSRSGGKRGCPNESGEVIPLTLLAPQTYVGYTTSLHPTFVGFVSSSQKIRFKLYQFDSKNTPQELVILPETEVKPGIFQLSLPSTSSKLIVGKQYLWQVAITCANSSETRLVEKAEFIVVEMPSTLKEQLSTKVDTMQKVKIYAEADLWYEALDEALKSAKTGKLGKLGINLIQELATSELSKTEDDQKRIQYLQAIATQEE